MDRSRTGAPHLLLAALTGTACGCPTAGDRTVVVTVEHCEATDLDGSLDLAGVLLSGSVR